MNIPSGPVQRADVLEVVESVTPHLDARSRREFINLKRGKIALPPLITTSNAGGAQALQQVNASGAYRLEVLSTFHLMPHSNRALVYAQQTWPERLLPPSELEDGNNCLLYLTESCTDEPQLLGIALVGLETCGSPKLVSLAAHYLEVRELHSINTGYASSASQAALTCVILCMRCGGRLKNGSRVTLPSSLDVPIADREAYLIHRLQQLIDEGPPSAEEPVGGHAAN